MKVKYKGEYIVDSSDKTKKLLTKGRFCEDDIEIEASGGGGSTVFLKNDSDKTYLENDKVLVNAGSIGSDTYFYDYMNHSSTVAYYVNKIPFFFDNNSFFTRGDGTGRNVTIYQDRTVFSTIPYDDTLQSVICHKNGLIVATETVYGGAKSYIVNKANYMEIPKISGYGTTYLGSYKGKHYVNDAYQGKMYYYDPTTNAIDTSNALFTGWGQVNSGYVSPETGSMIYSQWTNNTTSIAFFHIAEDDTVVLDNTIDNFTPNKAFAYTGADVGDRIFFVTDAGDYTNCYWNGYSLTQICRIVDTGNGKKGLVEDTSIPMLSTQNNRIFYDNRNDVLTIGTDNGVYAYRFDRTSKEFVQLELDIKPDTANEHVGKFMLALSPDLTKAVVQYKCPFSGSNDRGTRWNSFNLTTTDWRIVNNNPTNYNATVSFTGFATGNVDEDGKVEVQLLDIPTVNATVSTVDSEDYYSNIKLVDGGNNE